MKLIQDFLNFAHRVRRNGYMIRSMVNRYIRERYVGSFLGIFWSVLHPLTQIAIYYLIFSVILKTRLGPEYAGTSFALWLVAGLLPWLFFGEVLTSSPDAVLQQANLIKKSVFPSEILPLTHLGAAVVNHLIGLVIFSVFLLLFGDGLTWQILFLIPAMVALGVFILGFAWLLSALNVFLRDIGQVSSVLVNLWFFLTPIIYPRHLLPESLQAVYALNPMLYAVEAYRAALLGKTAIDMQGFACFALCGLAMLALGGIVFKKLKPVFADVL